jgi:ABC-type oligopeptide transport system substrate-binding subunit
MALLAISPALAVNVNATGGISNPSVIKGSNADLHGPRVNNLNYLLYTSDHASVSAILAGQQQILDFPPSALTDIQATQSDTSLNVTSETGSGEEFIQFNQCMGTCPNGDFSTSTNNYNGSVPSADLVRATSANLQFRQAIAQVVNYSFIQSTALNTIQGVATQELLYPNSFPNFSNTTAAQSPYFYYGLSLTAANASLAADPYLAWSATGTQPAASNTIACNGGTGVWEYSSTPGTPGGAPNGTVVEPLFYTRADHATWLTASTNIWQNAAKIGLCMQMIQVVGFSQILPVVYTSYSTNWEMYFGGVGFSSPLNAMTDFFDAFTNQPGWGNPFLNPTHFYNATINNLIVAGFSTSSTPTAQKDIADADGLLMQQIPYLNIWWDTTIIPSDNNKGGNYWSGYVDTPSFSTWTFATGLWTLLNAHMLNPTTGATQVGGTFSVGEHEQPDNLNAFQATSVYDFDVINSIFLDAPMLPSPGNPSVAGLIPWQLASPAQSTPFSGTTPHGYKVVGGQKIVMNFMNNITFSDNVPLTAADYNFSLWYTCLNGCPATDSWGTYSGNFAADFTGLMPDLTDSVVNSTYTMTEYVNGSSLSDYQLGTTVTTFPMHIWSQIGSTVFNNNVPPDACQQGGASGMTGAGPFIFSQWVKNSYVQEVRNPGYFRTDISDWSITAPFGTALALSANLTQAGAALPSSAAITATVVNPSTGAAISGDSATLTQGTPTTSWTGSLPTTGLTSGTQYEIVINGTYTSGGQAHQVMQFWGLTNGASVSAPSNPVPVVAALPSQQCSTYTPPTTTTTTTTTPPTSSTTTTPPTSSTTTTPPTSSTTTSPSNNNLLLIAAAVVVVIIVIAGIATYFVRRR